MHAHSSPDLLAFSSVAEIQAAFGDRRLTSSDLVRVLLERIASIDAAGSTIALRSVIAVASDVVEHAARCDAERAEGRALGRLHGIPVLVKDNIEARGLPATAGSLALANSTATEDAPVVARLRTAGAIVLGSTNLSEWANMRSPKSSSGWSAVGGLVANPWALDRSAGGSSSGSGAALAAGLSPLALGTETDGSIVCPAALNGVVGLKPTVGSLPTQGIVPISHSQDTPGPMARCVADVRTFWEVLSGAAVSPRDTRTLRLAGVPAWMSGHDATDALFSSVMAQLHDTFAAVGSVDVPEMGDEQAEDELLVMLAELHDDLESYLQRRKPASGVRTLADVIAFNEAQAEAELAHFGQEHFERAVTIGGVDARAAAARSRGVQWARSECLDPALANWDVLLAPTYAPAWKHDFALGHPDIGGAVTSPAAIAGYPLLSMPMGLVEGLPVGLTLVGRAGEESTLLEAAERIEQLLNLNADGSWRPKFSSVAGD